MHIHIRIYIYIYIFVVYICIVYLYCICMYVQSLLSTPRGDDVELLQQRLPLEPPGPPEPCSRAEMEELLKAWRSREFPEDLGISMVKNGDFMGHLLRFDETW